MYAFIVNISLLISFFVVDYTQVFCDKMYILVYSGSWDCHIRINVLFT